jgi:REP-associated tyrosine transposase
VFSTKDRLPSIHPDFRSDLFAYMGGIIRQLDGKAFIINGINDHVHIAMMMEADPSIREMMRVVKTNSSRWLHEKYPKHHRFAWQSGYRGLQRLQIESFSRDPVHRAAGGAPSQEGLQDRIH